MTAFAWIEVVADAEAAECVVAEVWAAGASGVEERAAGGGGTRLLVYAPRARIACVRRAAIAAVGAECVGAAAAVPDTDWAQTWKRGLAPVVVSERLRVRPSFTSSALAPGQRELVIDPERAFGTGSHATTRLALELADLALAEAPAARALDVGTGTGVLGLAALRLGVAEVVACDVDSVATATAAANARRNDLGERLRVFAGTLDALRGPPFDLVLANLIRVRLLPLLAAIAAAAAPGGRAVISGLLAQERAEIEAALVRVGLEPRAGRTMADERGDVWLALLTVRRPFAASR